ncbi:MAG: thymidine phosphorylase [Clostridiales bacterium]|nr:thymidine phosphorylase [Clostridiales bacterium]
MRMTDLIETKKAGQTLTEEEIRWMIDGYTAGDIPDYQMAAMAMAICWRGMDGGETAVLTDAMLHSGDTVDLSAFGPLTVDKHSTGGVGDKTTLIVAPVVASLGGRVAKMSGRGLGHTGGTIDKLESIPGFRTELSAEEFLRTVEQVGVAVIGQTGNLCPADKKLYALRDVTGTVGSLPLIASSIMSKKLAAGAKSIVLDVKIGSGAFMKTEAEGRRLAETMVALGRGHGRNTAALLTNMDVPLGHAVGNALEVREAAELLQGKGDDDLKALCVALSATLLSLCHGWSREEAEARVLDCIASGAAFETLCRWAEAQGGDASVLRDLSLLPQAAHVRPIYADRSGWITHMDARQIGEASVVLGAGRVKKGDPIDHAAGIVLAKKTGDAVSAGDVLAWLHTNRPDALDAAQRQVFSALTIGEEQPAPQKLIYGIVR